VARDGVAVTQNCRKAAIDASLGELQKVECPASTTFPGQRQLLFPTGLIS
jgi:hypothetical protein